MRNRIQAETWEELLNRAIALMPFKISDRVYMVCDKDQQPGMVNSLQIAGRPSYRVCWGTDKTYWHYDFELSKEKQAIVL
jgi:hypothetical protein